MPRFGLQLKFGHEKSSRHNVGSFQRSVKAFALINFCFCPVKDFALADFLSVSGILPWQAYMQSLKSFSLLLRRADFRLSHFLQQPIAEVKNKNTEKDYSAADKACRVGRFAKDDKSQNGR